MHVLQVAEKVSPPQSLGSKLIVIERPSLGHASSTSAGRMQLEGGSTGWGRIANCRHSCLPATANTFSKPDWRKSGLGKRLQGEVGKGSAPVRASHCLLGDDWRRFKFPDSGRCQIFCLALSLDQSAILYCGMFQFHKERPSDEMHCMAFRNLAHLFLCQTCLLAKAGRRFPLSPSPDDPTRPSCCSSTGLADNVSSPRPSWGQVADTSKRFWE